MSRGQATCYYMKDWDWTIDEKPYDLRVRLFRFACLIVRLVQFLHTRGPVARQLRGGGRRSSDADKLAKRSIALRELKETSFRLRVLRQTGLLPPLMTRSSTRMRS